MPNLLTPQVPNRALAIVPALLLTGFLTLLAVALISKSPEPAWAGSTEPVVAIGQVRAMPAGNQSMLEVTGFVGFDDILQINYPLGLVVIQGTHFVHFVLGSEPESGELAALADGLQISDLGALVAAGSPDATAEVVKLEPNRVLVALPPSIVDGVVHAVLYLSLPGEDAIVSNTVSTGLLGVGDAQ